MADDGAARLGSIKTQILVVWIFALLVLLAWIAGFLWYTIVLGVLSASTCSFAYCYTNPLVGFWIFLGVIFLVMMIPSILVFRHTNQMRSAANSGNVSRLKQLNSVGWGIVALIFTGVITGIMLLIVHGPINELGPSMAGGGVTGDSLDRLAKLKSLLDSGAMTKDEYEAQKNQVLHPEKAQPAGIEDELRKLKSLYDSGAITTAEYEDQKKKMLNRM